MKIQIAIPSYRRPAVCKARTVETLVKLGCKKDDMTIFVANEAEKEAYEKHGIGVELVVGVEGLINQRIWYNHYFDSGTPILNCDDDVYDLQSVDVNGNLVSYTHGLDAVVEHAIEVCNATKMRLWGICPYANGFYMQPYTTVGLKYICGIFHGSFAGDPVLCGKDRVRVSSGEDFETTIRSYKSHGGVVRLDWLCPVTKYFAAGGMQEELGGSNEARQVEHEKELIAISERHKGFATLYKKAGGVTNLKLKRMKSLKIPAPIELLL
tara:strand:- start:1627 stop:2427 length:801 start_codon:yes stop_codon:yes gene_type:complete